MTTASLVDFATFCCPKDVDRLYATHPDGGSYLDQQVRSNLSEHFYFEKVFVFHQQCPLMMEVKAIAGIPCKQVWYKNPREVCLRYIKDPTDIAESDASFVRHPHHRWEHHLANHLLAAELSTAEYMVFMDADCYIKERPADVKRSWVLEGIQLLKARSEVLYVCPRWSDEVGAETVGSLPGAHLHKTSSQQCILIRRETLLNLDWNARWRLGDPKAPGEPCDWVYFVLEGRLWRHMRDHGMFRASLNDYRWWHLQWH